MNTDLQKSEKIIQKVKESSKFLIVPDGSRVDWDCISSALSTKWWLEKMGKTEIKIYIFGEIPEFTKSIPWMDQIERKYIKEVDFDYYDMIFLLDAPVWSRILTRGYEKIFENVTKEKFYSIDHHDPEDIAKDIPDNTFAVHDCCTGKVLYDNLITPSGVELDQNGAQYLYMGLMGDTQCFRVAMYNDTFEFADKLMKAGVNHQETFEMINQVSQKTMDFTVWAIQNTKYYPEIKTTTLIFGDKLIKEANGRFGENWEKDDLIEYYKEVFLRKVEGYDYGLTFRWKEKEKMTRVSWRSRTNSEVEIMKVLQNAGFYAGGHRNSGGSYVEMDIHEAEKKFIEEMEKSFKN